MPADNMQIVWGMQSTKQHFLIQCACLLPTTLLKTYNVQTMWLLVIQVSLKSIKCVCLLPKCHLRFHKANDHLNACHQSVPKKPHK